MNPKQLFWITASFLLGNSVFAAPAGTVHYPDLVTLPPSDIGIENNVVTGKKFLRFSNSVVNRGDGPLEVVPINSPLISTTDAYQQFYSHDTNGNWYVTSSNRVGTFLFHPAHNHWHFEDFARYELHDVASDGAVGTNVFASAEKVGFCLSDDYLLDAALDHQSSQTYTNCDQTHPQGISVGWIDTYPWNLPDQYLEITGLPDGDYWLVSTVDPINLLNEGGGGRESNNTAAVKVKIGSDIIWSDDSVPLGAITRVSGGDSWNWIANNPTPFFGKLAHQSANKSGTHQHFFSNASGTLAVNTNNTLFTYVFLDPANPPSEVMLQWNDTTNWEHRAYWGTNSISLGTNGTPSRRYVGPLPTPGQWARLEVPASQVNLEGSTVSGMYFTLYNGSAAWDFTGVTVAPSSTGTTPRPFAISIVPPTINFSTTSAFGISVGVMDGTSQLKGDSVRLTFDGKVVTPSISKSGALTTIKYDAPLALASKSAHAVTVEFADAAGLWGLQTFNLSFVAPEYALVPPEFSISAGLIDTSKSGFMIRTFETAANNPNTLAWTEDQLDGKMGANLANLSGVDSSGYYGRDSVINFDIGGGAGNFPNDDAFPGLPGSGTRDSGTGNSAIEVLTVLAFPSPGLYTMGVNSDDGFRVTTGANALDKFSVKLGEFDGVRGPSDTLFHILVTKPGFFPFRLIWESGGGSANVEWFTVNIGAKILINDRGVLDSIKAYRSSGPRPYVKAVSPVPGAVDVSITNTISVTLADGAYQVQTSSIQLFLNDQATKPVIVKNSGITTVTYVPIIKPIPESKNTVRLVYSDNAAPANLNTNEFSFMAAPEIEVLVGINSAQKWRFNDSGSDLGTTWKEQTFDDSSWSIGTALFEGKKGTIPDLPEPIRGTLTIDSSISTYYFRTHFNFTGNPSGARLRLRCIVDDGAIFYLNGVEIYRAGMPSGLVTSATLASRTVNDAAYEGPFEIPARGLLAGDNVLAVEVHQASLTSSDVTMGSELISVTSNPVRTSIENISPAPDSVGVARDTGIEINLSDGSQKVQVTSIQLSVNGQVVTPTISKSLDTPNTKISFHPSELFSADTKVAIKLVFIDDARPPNVTSKDFTFTTKPEIVMLVALDDKQAWRFDDTGKDLGTAWRSKEFDDSSWKSGVGLFEGKKGTVPILAEPIRTSLTLDSTRTNFYFRTHFAFNGDPASAQLKIKAIIDDGAVFYLNGVEVLRVGMPAGTISASTLASRTVNDAAYEGPYDIPSSSLVAGDNVLAVEVHQASASSSDVTMGTQLFTPGSIVNPPPPALKFSAFGRVGTGLKIEWTASAKLQASDSVIGPWLDVTNASSPFTINLDGNAKFYRLKQ